MQAELWLSLSLPLSPSRTIRDMGSLMGARFQLASTLTTHSETWLEGWTRTSSCDHDQPKPCGKSWDLGHQEAPGTREAPETGPDVWVFLLHIHPLPWI